jgi:SSS family solute:Na+ symporter
VHDFYQRFIKRGMPEKHYVMAGRVATVILFILSSSLVFVLDSAKDAFDVILQIGAGTGLLYLIRWFWWRVNAWCEVVAMVSSFAVSLVLLILARNGIHFSTHMALITTILITTVSWLVTAFAGPQTDRKVLIEFYRKVLPFGPGWRQVREEAGITEEQARATHENIPMALLGWVAGCTVIWSALFTVGNFLYGRQTYAFVLLAIFIISGVVLVYLVNRLWETNTGK